MDWAVFSILYLVSICLYQKKVNQNVRQQRAANELQNYRALMHQHRRTRSAPGGHQPTASQRPVFADETTPLLAPVVADFLTPTISRSRNNELLIHCHIFHRTLEQHEDIHEVLSHIENQQQLQPDDNEKGKRRHIFGRALHQASSGVRSLRSGLLGSNQQSVACSICLDQYLVGDTICWAKTNECNHIFHQDCIVQWLQDHDECPLCRVDIFAPSV